MVVQSTNTGGDLSDNHFDIQMPGGGLGVFDGCSPQFGSTLPGERYGGVTSRSQCDQMPELLKDGCHWRFDWFENADNPDFTFEQVQCPKAITDVTGCKRNDDELFPVFKGAGKPAPGGEETVKPTSTKVAAEATKAPEASEPTVPKPVEETGNGTEKPDEDETVKPVDDGEDTVEEDEDCEEVVDDEEDGGEIIEDDEDCEEGGEVIEDEDEEEDEEDCEESETVEEDDDEETETGAEAALYGQCGGKNWTGATKCAEGSKCEHWNPYYFQCIAA